MANVLERYGIKEVADLTIYKLNADGTMGAPVLKLDSLKVSTLETTAESVYAQGGKGNAKLVGWDFGKEITLNVEDALFSPKSMALIFGNGTVTENATQTIKKTISFVKTAAAAPTQWVDTMGTTHAITSPVYYGVDGETVEAAAMVEGETYYITFNITVDGLTITVGPNTFPGTYAFVGETLARSELNGQDEPFMFVIPKGKITSETTLTLEADGDPAVFSFNVEVMKAKNADGKDVMIELTKYALA